MQNGSRAPGQFNAPQYAQVRIEPAATQIQNQAMHPVQRGLVVNNFKDTKMAVSSSLNPVLQSFNSTGRMPLGIEQPPLQQVGPGMVAGHGHSLERMSSFGSQSSYSTY